MDPHDSNKRLKSSSGAPIKKSQHISAAANLPAYQPPAAGGGARGGSRPTSTRPSASIARPANGKTSLRLTVKAAPSKLRQATSGSQISAQIPPNPYADNASESDATPGPVVRTARSTRNPRTVVEPESEEEDESEEEEDEPAEEDEELEGEEQDEDPQSEDHELEDAEDSEEDAEGDEDEEMDDAEDDHPPPPIIKTSNPLGRNKPNVTVTAPPEGPLQSVEDKEMDDEEEEELSSLDSNENDEEDDEDDDSTSSSDEDGSRSATPDLSKLTRRQRGLYEEADASLMALSNEAQKKKHLTAEEHAMRRAEMARRRKNLSEKRNEEEKMDTINKLLKKPAPKRRTRAEILAAQQAGYLATPGAEEGEEERADPLFVRWTSSQHGSRLGVPDEWMELDGNVGELFRAGWSGGGRGRMVEEVG